MTSLLAPLAQKNLLDRISANTGAILQYDSKNRDLQTWAWPINERKERVPLYCLAGHRVSHHLMNPCCLCASDNGITEAAILISMNGAYDGQYVAACANDRCGYVVPLEHFYHRAKLPVIYYPRRGHNDMVPPPVVHVSECMIHEGIPGDDSENVGQPTSVARDEGKIMYSKRPSSDVSVPMFNPPPNIAPSVTEQLEKLDYFCRPGLTDREFKQLFAKCRCGMVVTRRMFLMHECIRDVPVVDLTVED